MRAGGLGSLESIGKGESRIARIWQIMKWCSRLTVHLDNMLYIAKKQG